MAATPFVSLRAASQAQQANERMKQLFPIGLDFHQSEGHDRAVRTQGRSRPVSPAVLPSPEETETSAAGHDSSPPPADYSAAQVRSAIGDASFVFVPPPPTYPEDWRRLPLPERRDTVEWVYAWASMERQQTTHQVFQQAVKSVARQLAAKGIHPVSELAGRSDVRAMVRSAARCGVMVDVIATRRRLLSGDAHDAAMQLYKHMETHYPVQCIFMVVGITDNRGKCVARDVFNADPVAGARKLPFSELDGEHMMLVHPVGNEGEAIRQIGRAVTDERELARRRRTHTPKFVPPPLPACIAAADERRSNLAASRPGSRGSMAWSRPTSSQAAHRHSPTRLGGGGADSGLTLPECARCWRHDQHRVALSRPTSPANAADAQASGTATASSTVPRSLSPTQLAQPQRAAGIGRRSSLLASPEVDGAVDGPIGRRDGGMAGGGGATSTLAALRRRRRSSQAHRSISRSRGDDASESTATGGAPLRDADGGSEGDDAPTPYSAAKAVIDRIRHRHSLHVGRTV